jgi:hypothetical protein
MAIWNILWTFGIFYDRFGIMHKEKSGNPAADPFKVVVLKD